MIFLTGATGFIGSNIVEKCKRNNIKLCGFVRNQQKKELLKNLNTNAEYIIGDLLEMNDLEKIKDETETIVHAAVIHDSDDPNSIFNRNVQITKNIIEIAKKKKIKNLIYFSSIEATQNSEDPYPKSKKISEDLIRNSGLNWAIVRPSLVYGEVDHLRTLSRFVAQVSEKKFVTVIGDGNNKMQPVFIDDLVELVFEIADKKFYGQTITLAGPYCQSYNQILDEIADFMDKKIVKIHIPKHIIYSIAWLCSKLKPNGNINVNKIKMFLRDEIVKNEKVNKQLNNETVPFCKGIRLWKDKYDNWDKTNKIAIFQ